MHNYDDLPPQNDDIQYKATPTIANGTAVKFQPPTLIQPVNTIEFIKAASDTVLGMVNAADYDKPLILIMTYTYYFRKEAKHSQGS